MLCYDGSEDAKHAVRRAGELFAGRSALVLTVWQSTAVMGGFAWAGAMAPMVDYVELDRMSAEAAGKRAEEGLGVARDAGLEAEALTVRAAGPIWRTIIETADQHRAAVIVMGPRGLTGVESMLLGSVSSHVVHHADRPALVIPVGATGRASTATDAIEEGPADGGR
ncbi:MAG: universal stress protein [Solirubrobacteraceae bacterium]